MTIDVDIRHNLGRFQLEARFSSSGRLTALFGPSGSGKTSVVNLIGGLTRPIHGRIAVDGRVLVDTDAGVFVPRHKRRIGYVFQEPRLFPHMSVRHNLEYGAWFTPVGERHEDFDRVADLLGIRHLLDRAPGPLSGGEKQRIAIGRALLTSPRLLLMDEPLASLDSARKGEIMPYIERLRDESGIPIIYVSHSIEEVARLSTDMVVMADGRIVESGATREIMQRLDVLPADDTGEAGVLLDTVIESFDSAYGMSVLRSPAGQFRIAGRLGDTGMPVRLRVRARDVIVATERPRKMSALNVLSGKVSGIGGASGPLVDVSIDCSGEPIIARITRQSLEGLGLTLGLPAFAIVKTVSFDPRGLARIVPEKNNATVRRTTGHM
jgi:molybdate transport system ATP-binding protein